MAHPDTTAEAGATLDEFLADERATLKRFEDWWRDLSGSSPDMFPERLGLGDWWEQLLSFVTTEDEPRPVVPSGN